MKFYVYDMFLKGTVFAEKASILLRWTRTSRCFLTKYERVILYLGPLQFKIMSNYDYVRLESKTKLSGKNKNKNFMDEIYVTIISHNL